MKPRLLRLAAATAITVGALALPGCAVPCDDVAGSTVLADDDCGEDDD